MEVEPTFLLQHFSLFGFEFQYWLGLVVALFVFYAIYLWGTRSKSTWNANQRT
jgi:hypothetical protein